MEYHGLTTERRNPRSAGLDRMGTAEILRLMNEEDRRVPGAVAEALPEIARAVDLIVGRLAAGGTLFYVGAGTSGRLGVLDAAECLPTFGVGPGVVTAIIAGGPEAVFRSVEEAEDDEERGRSDIAGRVAGRDFVVGVSASGITPYVRGALAAARETGAGTAAVVCNRPSPDWPPVDALISLVVGPEVLTGSTRLKAGTAQKLVLNMLSTASMVRLGKVYDNLMVDLQPTNRKLHDRAVRIVAAATGKPAAEAVALLDASAGGLKAAVVMGLAGVGANAAAEALTFAGGHVRAAVEAVQGAQRR